MIKNILRYIFVLLVLLAFNNCAKGAIKIWLGGTAGADNWNIAGNWSSSGVPTSTDDVQIGIAAFANQPNISSGTPICHSITFGVAQAVQLTVNSTLTVTTSIIQNHSSTTGAGASISNIIQGTGSITCISFTVGNTTTPGSQTNSAQTFNTTITCSINSLTVSGTLGLNSTSLSHNGNKHDCYNPVFNLTGGALTVANITISAITNSVSSFLSGNAETFNMGTSTTANTLNISGSITVPAGINGTVSFLSAIGNTSASTVNYTGSGVQAVVTGGDAFVVSTPTTYGNLGFSGAGTKTLDVGALTVGGTLINNTGSTLNGNTTASTAIITGAFTNDGTINVNNESCTFSSTASNTGTYAPGTGAGTSTFSNALTNSGAFTGGAGAITITAGAGTLTNNSGGTVTGGAGGITVTTLANNSGGNINGSGTAGSTIKVNGTSSNSGTITVNNGTMTFTGLFTNNGTGIYTGGTGNGISTFSNGVGNSGSFTGGAGAIGVTGTLTNTGGTVTGGTGTITIATMANNSGNINGSSTTGAFTVNGTSGNSGTITVNNGTMTFTGLFINTGTYIGGAGTSTFTTGLTNSLTVTESTGQFTIGNLTNTSPGTFTGNSAAATTSVTGTLTNSGTITVNAENMTFSSAASNSGTYDATSGAGTSTFTTGLTNTGTVNEGTGTFTIANLVNTSPGIFNGNTSTAATSTIGTLTNSGTITVGFENLTFSGAAANSGTYTCGTPGVSTFNGSFTNSTGGTFAAGTADVNFNGDYTNSATFTGNATGKVIFGGAGTQTLTDNSTNGTTVINMFVQGSGTKTMAGSKGFFLASTGILTMAGSATLNGGGALTLISDANSTATVAPVPATCSFAGNENVQRFIKGSSDLSIPDLSKRGYRLISSAVYTGTDPSSGAHVSDLLYLTNSVYVSGAGGAANGFNVSTTQNPSLYLFREDIAPPPNATTIFTTGYNWKGVAKINNSPTYLIGTQAKNTTTNILDATVTIPVGNGVLFLFRGDKTASLVAPLTPPNDVTLTQTGTLNTGTVNVRLWYADATNNLGNNLSYTPGNVSATVLTGGYTLVGNPYASTINWEKYNANATVANSSIYGSGGLNSKIYFFNPTNKQYEPYQPTGTDTVSVNPINSTPIGQASNMIASGQGFFIKATAAGSQSLTFRESAKTSTQPIAASLNQLMGAPKAFAAAPRPLLRLKMSMDSINTDEIVIRLNSQSGTKFADNKDAEDLDGGGALVSLSAFSSDKARLAIYSTPFPGQQQQVIPLFTDATASGLYKLERTQLTNLPALYDVWLKDAFTNDSLDMKANSLYQFTIDRTNPATFGSTRFTLVIRQNPALAYKLLDFNAARIGSSSHVEVVWHTENEQNYTNFTVERSNDGGTTFDVVGGLQGTGAGNYSLVDKNAFNGQNLYRLKQEDLNNTITYSKVVAVLIDGKGNKGSDNKLSIYPNPATNNISLAIAEQSTGNTSYSIRFMSSSGIMIKQITSSQPGWQGNISNLQPGTYLVRVINNKTQNLVGENKFVKL